MIYKGQALAVPGLACSTMPVDCNFLLRIE